MAPQTADAAYWLSASKQNNNPAIFTTLEVEAGTDASAEVYAHAGFTFLSYYAKVVFYRYTYFYESDSIDMSVDWEMVGALSAYAWGELSINVRYRWAEASDETEGDISSFSGGYIKAYWTSAYKSVNQDYSSSDWKHVDDLGGEEVPTDVLCKLMVEFRFFIYSGGGHIWYHHLIDHPLQIDVHSINFRYHN